jgi:hypothetical protein
LEHHQGHEGELGTQKSDEPIEDGALEHGDDGEDADHPAPGDPERRRASAFRRPPHRG